MLTPPTPQFEFDLIDAALFDVHRLRNLEADTRSYASGLRDDDIADECRAWMTARLPAVAPL